MKKRVYTTLAAALLMVASAQAATVGGITLPENIGGLQLQGAGLLRKGFIFKVYVGALYLADPAHAQNVLGPVPKRIDIHYFHHTPKKYMIRVANATLAENLTPQQLSELQPKVERLHAAYRDGRKGSFASIIHRPGEGLVYAFDNEPVLHIPDDDFANAYFTIWLGEQPSSRTVKNAMLGNHDAR